MLAMFQVMMLWATRNNPVGATAAQVWALITRLGGTAYPVSYSRREAYSQGPGYTPCPPAEHATVRVQFADGSSVEAWAVRREGEAWEATGFGLPRDVSRETYSVSEYESSSCGRISRNGPGPGSTGMSATEMLAWVAKRAESTYPLTATGRYTYTWIVRKGRGGPLVDAIQFAE